MMLTIMGKRWTLRRARIKEHGECDGPHISGKEIRVRAGLKGRAELETYIHEMLHAADWMKDEEWVQQTGHDLARALWRLGYRRE